MEIRPLSAADFDAVVALQRLCFPAPFPAELLWKPEHLKSHLARYPEGQFVAVREGQIVGSASALRIPRTRWEQHPDWEGTCGDYAFAGHDPKGGVLFAADISVHPEVRGLGIARKLYGARMSLVGKNGIAVLATACRIPDFRASGLATPQAFAEAVVAATKTDRTLTPLLRIGMKYQGVVENHMDDEESGHAAAILEWTP